MRSDTSTIKTWFVGHDQIRLHRQRPSQKQTLPLPAAELMGILVQELCRRHQSHQREQLLQPTLASEPFFTRR